MSPEKTETTHPACAKHGPYTGRLCPDCERERAERLNKQIKELAEQDRRQRIADNRKRAGIPIRFASCTFENYVAGSEKQRRALALALAFAEQFETVREAGGNLTFCGAPGCGKTHLACAIGNQLLDSGRTVIYTQAIEMVRAIRDTWRRDSDKSGTEVINRYRNTALLIVDEIGVQFGSDAERTHFFDVLDGRYREMRPSLIISNLNEKGLQEFLGSRLFDRFMEKGSTVAVFDWGSYRRIAAPKPSQRSEQRFEREASGAEPENKVPSVAVRMRELAKGTPAEEPYK
jgi:DNA replication protein DnaC